MTCVGSTGRFPVMSSKSMTPNEKTSDFSVNFPLDAYSGAKYLFEYTKLDYSVGLINEYDFMPLFTQTIHWKRIYFLLYFISAC